jgi:RNA polymerase sigma-70 factor (ECF subfamily)
MSDNPQQLHDDILACLPHLRAFAHLLARDRALAEDLVQDTVLRALTYHHQFKPGTNFRGWLIIILRNRYFNEMRRRSRRSETSQEVVMADTAASGGQEERLEVRDFMRSFETLPSSQREALLLVGASGFSYEEAAHISGCAVGTMKSRVSRARLQLQTMLEGSENASPELMALLGTGEAETNDRVAHKA